MIGTILLTKIVNEKNIDKKKNIMIRPIYSSFYSEYKSTYDASGLDQKVIQGFPSSFMLNKYDDSSLFN